MRDVARGAAAHIAQWRRARYQRGDQGGLAGGDLTEDGNVDGRGRTAAVEFAQLVTEFLNVGLRFAQCGDTRFERRAIRRNYRRTRLARTQDPRRRGDAEHDDHGKHPADQPAQAFRQRHEALRQRQRTLERREEQPGQGGDADGRDQETKSA